MGTRTVRQALLLLSLLMATAACLALDVPFLSGRVVDNAQMLSPDARERIIELSRQHEQQTGNQIAVLTVRTLESESIEEFAVRVFEDWKLGEQGKDNGVLLVISLQERSLRIEVGYGLEGTLPDVIASRIIRDVITPQFKSGHFDAGVTKGVRAIIAELEGRAPPAVETASSRGTAHIAQPRLPKRLVIAYGIIFVFMGLFALGATLFPGVGGWVFCVLTIPCWGMFSLGAVGARATLILIGVQLVAVAVGRALLSRRGWYEKAYDSSSTGGGGFSRGWSSRSWSSGSRGSGRSRGFSGRGGRSGGGGASGRW